ncbi:type III-B CRISPR module-associated protein Cmr5 [Paenibacillus sp. WLX2291]|uniref:type III-B CRISPR module-associated protein Cmr5 n=1 Tax=Paenibacillus sp. WLX2291 TaxID=3296934 RepID=UPI003983E0B1
MKRTQQHYAEIAYGGIIGIANLDDLTLESIAQKQADPKVTTYGRLCHRFPAMVRHNGLQLTLVFFYAKANVDSSSASDSKKQTTPVAQAYECFLKDMYEAIVPLHHRPQSISASAHLQQWIHSMQTVSPLRYYDMSRRALDASVWFKRYAEAILQIDQTAVEDDLTSMVEEHA